MPAGTWAQLPQTNIDTALGRGGVSGNQLHFALAMAWDPIRLKLHYTGSDHNDGVTNYMTYDATTNSWSFLGSIPLTPSHGYDHNTIDPNTGILYVREYGIALGGTRIWQLPPGGSWSMRTSWNPTQYVNVANGTTWWRGQLRGAGANGALVIYNCGAVNGQVLAWNPSNDAWFADITGFGGSSTYHCFAEYSPVYNVALFGGGNLNPRTVWRLNADRTVTALTSAPVDLGVQRGNVTVDPVTGDFLIMGYGQLWQFNPRGGGTWTQQIGPRTPPSAVGNPGPPELDAVVSVPISNFGSPGD
jgi:hypothetical protein